MAAAQSSLTPAEWQVMECLWAHAPRTGRETVQCMAEQMGWSRSTTLTLLQRMEDKGTVRCELRDGKRSFFPMLQREDAALQETEDLLHRAYRGSVSLLLSSLTRRQTLPREEIDRLYALLQELENTQSPDTRKGDD